MTSFPLNWYSTFLFPGEESKLETIKMMGTCIKINAISLNFKINTPNLVGMCAYELPINVQNSMQKDVVSAKISLKVLGGYFFGLTLYILH